MLIKYVTDEITMLSMAGTAQKSGSQKGFSEIWMQIRSRIQHDARRLFLTTEKRRSLTWRGGGIWLLAHDTASADSVLERVFGRRCLLGLPVRPKTGFD